MNDTLVVYICIFTAIAIGNFYLSNKRKKQNGIEIKGIENILLSFNDDKTKLILNKTETVQALIKLLPIEGNMKNAGGKLSLKLPTSINNDPIKVTQVYKGDIMLEENDKLVIFLEDQNVNKNYTKLGKVLLINKLDEIKDIDEVTITINKG